MIPFGHSVASDWPLPSDQLVSALADGVSALITGADGTTALLAAVEQRLQGARTRVLRVRPPLDLPDLMQQVSPADPARGGSGPEKGFEALTVTRPGCDRITLLVEDAHLVPRETLRYIELALRAGPHLQVVLAGQPGLLEICGLYGLPGLCQRLPLRIALPGSPPARPNPLALLAGQPLVAVRFPVPASPGSQVPRFRRRTPCALAASAALAAGLMLALWMPGVPPASAPTIGLVAPSAAPGASARAEGGADGALPAPDAALPSNGVAPPEVEVAWAPLEAAPDAERPPAPTEVTAPLFNAAPTIVAGQVHVPDLDPPSLPVAAGQTTPPLHPHLQLRPVTPRVERVSAEPAPSSQDDRRCRRIISRAQLGETPTDSDRTFLRNGCH